MNATHVLSGSLLVASLVGIPALAQAAPVIAQARTSSLAEDEELRGRNPVMIIVLVAALLAGLIVLLQDDNPTSP